MALAPEVLEALTGGKVYDLATEFYVGMPRRMSAPPFSFSLIRRHADAPDPSQHSSAACLFSMGDHTGTHIDAFNHIGEKGKVYGHDEPVLENESYGEGVLVGSVSETPPILGRGVLLDIPRLKGVDVLDPHYGISAEDLSAAERLEGVQVRAKDILLIRTGWMKFWTEDPYRYNAPDPVVPGVGLSAGEWLVQRGVSFTGSDTTAYEKVDQTKLAVHTLLLGYKGVQIMENMYLEELARDRVYEFVFIGLPLKIRGATASPLRPIAVV